MSDFDDKIAECHMSPLWTVMSSLLTPTPKSGCQPHLWDYDKARPLLLRSGEIISAREAVRRVLVLENPGMTGLSQITTSLYAGLQLVLPGEIAPSHRHSQTALRFVLEGKGAHTAVNGEKVYMAPGDLIITPAMTWHDHGNTTDEPVIWLDGLDIPVVQFFDASFVEDYERDEYPQSAAPGTNSALYGAGLLPLDGAAGDATASQLFSYPYERARQTLFRLAQSGANDPHHGLKMHYANPLSGGHAISTMASFLQLLEKGLKTRNYRSTDAGVYVCVEGSGTSMVNGKPIGWKKNDIFVVPSWASVSHEAENQSVLFSFSDRAAQEKLGLWREQKD